MSTPDTHEESRLKNLATLRGLGLDPYANPGGVLESVAEVRRRFRPEFGKDGGPVSRVAGRIVLRRQMGKLGFLTISGADGRIQIGLDKSRLDATTWAAVQAFDLGDLIVAGGPLGATNTGEVTIWATEVGVTAKCLTPPPDKVAGLTDQEQKYRRRHLDLIANPETRSIMRQRAEMVAHVRTFLQANGYLEVETPLLHPLAGGAAAKPFETHHNALDIPLFLRIAPELYLKRLLVGGFDRVFEVGKNFRNEGLSPRHNPEFTVLEAYQAYGDYRTMLDLTIELIRSVGRNVFGRTHFDYGQHTIDLDSFRVVRLDELVPGPGTPEEKYARYEKEVEPTLIQPTAVTHLPASLVPLAKESKEFPGYAEVFELVIAGQEIAPGYTEQNEPDAQLRAFQQQAGEDRHVTDTDFVDALKSGMPPAGGMGLGIDRLAAILLNQPNIRDVILFPLMRPIG